MFDGSENREPAGGDEYGGTNASRLGVRYGKASGPRNDCAEGGC